MNHEQLISIIVRLDTAEYALAEAFKVASLHGPTDRQAEAHAKIIDQAKWMVISLKRKLASDLGRPASVA